MAVTIILEIAKNVDSMSVETDQARPAMLCFICNVGRVFGMADRNSIFMGYRFAWLTEFLLNEELSRFYKVICARR
jgi:hypothetical protein